MDILRQVFRIVTELVPHRNVGAGFIRRFTDTNVYGIGYVKIWKTRHKFPWIYGYFFYSVEWW